MIINFHSLGSCTPLTIIDQGKLDRKYGSNWMYIGRRNGYFDASILNNKFKIGVDGNREQVIELYRQWLEGEVLKGNKLVLNALRQSRGKVLVCWCRPARCHGDVIEEVAKRLYP